MNFIFLSFSHFFTFSFLSRFYSVGPEPCRPWSSALYRLAERVDLTMPSKIAVRDKQLIKQIKLLLEKHQMLSKSHKISALDSTSYIYSLGSPHETTAVLEPYVGRVEIIEFDDSDSDSVDKSLEAVVRQYLENASRSGVDLDVDHLMSRVPKRWSVYHPMVLFGEGGFDLDVWNSAFGSGITRSSFFGAVRTAFPATITHFAANRPIVESDIMRRPFNLVPLHGDFGPDPSDQLFDSPEAGDLEDAFWCHVVQNGIYQTWAPRYTMFSRGNIKEKKRVLDSFPNLKGLVVMDLYAGIGYFTFSYLANGAVLMCWEVNPWSIEGLVKGLAENGYKYKVFGRDDDLTRAQYEELRADGVRAFVFHESNDHVELRLLQLGKLPISHVNLGLLPTLQGSWGTVRAIRDLYTTQRMVAHVHENEHKDRFEELQTKISDFYGGENRILHLEKVKTFAPDVWHVVVDVEMGHTE